MTPASVGRSTSSNGVKTNTAALRPVRSSAAARSRAVTRSSAPRSPLVVSPSSGGTTTTTSRIRSGGTPARMTLPARVARKLTVSSGSLTQKASGVPARRRDTSSLANVTARTSSSERNGSWRFHAIAEPASIASVSAEVTTTASVRRRSSRCHTRTSPSAARIGIANPNVTNRSAGSHPVTSANATPTNVSRNHERRIRPALPLGDVKPRAASGTETHWTYRVQRCTKRSRYALRSSDVRPARRRNASFDVSTSRGGAPGRTARSPIPSTAPPPSAAAASRNASRRSCRQARAAATSRIARQSRRNWGCARPPPASTNTARTAARRLGSSSSAPAARNAAAVIRFATYPAARWTANVPASSPASVHPPAVVRRRTRAAAARPTATPSATSRAAVACTTESPERPLQDQRQRRRPGPIRDRGQPFDAGEPGPPQVDRARRDPPGTPRPLRRTARGTTRAGRGRGPRSGTRRSCSPLGSPLDAPSRP